jgi:hypothetical protein
MQGSAFSVAGVGRQIISRGLLLMALGACRATRPIGDYALLSRNTTRKGLCLLRKQADSEHATR